MVGTAPHSASNARTTTLETSEKKDLRRAPVLALLRTATDLYRSGRYLDSMRAFEATHTAAIRAALPDLAARALGNIGGCQFALHQYAAALATFQETVRQANAAGDTSAAAVFDANISSLYTEMGEFENAAQWMQGALSHLAERDRAQRPKMIIQLAVVRARQSRMDEARRLFADSIRAADSAGNWEMAAQGWHRLGEEYLQREKNAEAEGPLLEGYRIRQLHRLPLDASYRALGRLRLEQGDLDAASALLDRAIEDGSSTWDAYHYRGRTRLKQGRLREAIADLRIAIRLAREWRWNVLPEDAARIGAEGELEAVHSAFVEAGNRLYQQTHEPALLRETFEAAEENRASSLRALLRSHEMELRNSFPPQYWESLARLQRAEVKVLRTGAGSESLAAARSDLERLESTMGPAVAPLPVGILRRTQQHLSTGSVLLSFHLGDRVSWLWTLTPDSLSMQELPGRAEIVSQVRAAAAAIRSDKPDSGRLWETLFGGLNPDARQAGHWFVALDRGLFDAPLAALREPDGALVAERHIVETIPGAGYWIETIERPRAPSARLFVGLGDPIYNTADPRLPQSSHRLASGTLSLPRLVASATELEESSRVWNGSRVLLEGATASREKLQEQLKNHPAVIHIATHVVESAERPAYGMIALSLTPQHENQLISPFEIAGWRTDARLIVLSGCNSGAGEALPGTGLLGLTRAWLTAGARAVIATNWSTPDTSGALFQSLYRHLAARPDAGPADALHAAQLEMIHATDWRANPRYWGAFFATGAE
jgi:tetratricopeptide (TPR) repeat protein